MKFSLPGNLGESFFVVVERERERERAGERERKRNSSGTHA